jgi:hypothetical protein
MIKVPAKLMMVQGFPYLVTQDKIDYGDLYVRYDEKRKLNIYQCYDILHREDKTWLIDKFDSSECWKIVAEPSQIGMMDKLTTFKFLWFFKYSDIALSEMDESDIEKILKNNGDCFIELVNEFESPEMFADSPWGDDGLRILFVDNKIVIYLD